jgi:PAS domain S-box-containing protein
MNRTNILAYKQAFESSIDAIISADQNGRITLWNPAAEKMFGYKKKEALKQSISLLVPEEFKNALNIDMSNLVTANETLTSGKIVEAIGLRKNGSTFPIELNISAQKMDDWIFVVVLRDISERKEFNAWENLKNKLAFEIEEKAKRAVELIVANKKLAFENMEKGKRAEELIVANRQLAFENEEKGKRAEELIVANRKLAFENEEKGKRAEELIVANKKLAFENIEKGKRAEEAVLANTQAELSLREKEALLKEIHHRVKNNLQVISAFLMLQASNETEQHSLDILQESQRRVMDMFRLHENLYMSEDLGTICIRDYLTTIMDDVLVNTTNKGTEIVNQIDVDEIHFNISQAMALGHIVSELLSNSIKYAFEGRQSGKIEMTLHRIGDKKIMLAFSDDGKGLPKNYDIQSSKTLGLKLVTGLVQQLHGTISIGNCHGLSVKIQFPELSI